MYREWTAEGEGERKQAFDVITKELSVSTHSFIHSFIHSFVHSFIH